MAGRTKSEDGPVPRHLSTTPKSRERNPLGSPGAPDTLPFTTAASEFLYGYGVVLAVLMAGRRKLYKLYIHDRGMKNEGKDVVVARARAAGVEIKEVGDAWLRVMDKASTGRPHNVGIEHLWV
jgi:21S rRNA (GM2251-2'-O)-methyltransferase